MPGALVETKQAAPELLQQPTARSRSAAQEASERAHRVGGVTGVRSQVGLGQRQRHAVLGGVEPGEERRPARGAHRGVAEAVREGESGAGELGIVGHQLPYPSGLVRPMARCALLIGDQQDDVGLRGHGARIVSRIA
jgi:hypothetical protein